MAYDSQLAAAGGVSEVSHHLFHITSSLTYHPYDSQLVAAGGVSEDSAAVAQAMEPAVVEVCV